MTSILTCLLLARAGSAAVRNLPESFYRRDGLENMPRVDYEAMPLVNVKDVGARGDGETIENPFFDAAVARLKERGGGVLYVPEGRYFFRPPVCNKQGRVSWRNEGVENLHITGAGPEKTVVCTEFDAVHNSGAPSPYLWSFGGCRGITVRDVGFSLFPLFGMRTPRFGEGVYPLAFGGTTGAHVVNVFCDQGRIAICFWPGNADGWVVDCDVRNTGADAIKFDMCRRMVAAYNYVENSNDDAFSGLWLGKDIPSEDNRFLHNTILYNRGWGRGIAISGKNHAVVGNWLEAQAMPAVYVHTIGHKGYRPDAGPNGPHLIAANTMIRCDLHGVSANRLRGHRRKGAIALNNDVSDITIRENLIAGSASDGIAVASTSPGLEVEGLEIVENTIVSGLTSGIGFRADRDGDRVRDVTVERNRIFDHAGGSILFAGRVEGLAAAGNVIGDAAVLQEGFPALARYVQKRIVVDGGAAKGTSFIPTGCRLTYELPEYRDVYRAARIVPDETEWLSPPVARATGPTVNVRDLGARGDGTTSDTAAFARAFAALPPEGGIVRVPSGRYRIEPLPGQDTMPFTCVRHHLAIRGRAGVQLAGEGEASILRFTGSTHEGLRVVGCRDVSVVDLVLEVAAASPHRKNRTPLDVVASTGVVLRDLVLRRSIGHGLRIDSCRGALVENCRVESAGQIGIAVLAGRQVTVRHCTIRDSRDYGIHVGAVGGIARMSQRISIEGNEIAGSREAHGISITTGDHVRVEGNGISGTYQAGVAVYSVNAIFPVERVEVRRNVLTGCASGRLSYMRGAISAFYVPSADRRTAGRAELVIRDNLIYRTPANGVWVDRCGGLGLLVVMDNRFEDVGGEAISISEKQRAGTVRLEVE